MSDKSYLVRTGSVLITCCIIALLAGILMYGYICKTQQQEKIVVQFVVQTDSLGKMLPAAQNQVDSLVAVMERHEHLLQDKYEHILEQKEIFNDVLTLGGMLLAVVLSLFGFFGYKSLNAIEENVKGQAEIIANETAKTSFKQKFYEFKKETKEELEGHINTVVKEQTGKQMAEQKNAMRQSVDDKVKKAINTYGEQLDEQKSTTSNIMRSLDNLDEKYSKLNDRLLKIEDGQVLKGKPRRSLANGGRMGFVPETEGISQTNPDTK